MKKRSYPFKVLSMSEIWSGHTRLKSCERFAVYAGCLCNKTVMVVQQWGLLLTLKPTLKKKQVCLDYWSWKWLSWTMLLLQQRTNGLLEKLLLLSFSVFCKFLPPLSSGMWYNCLLHLATLFCYVANMFGKKPLSLPSKGKVWERSVSLCLIAGGHFVRDVLSYFHPLWGGWPELPCLRSKYYLPPKYLNFTWQ